MGGSPPISSDPPFHQHARKVLLPAFTKTAISRQEPATRALCDSLIDEFAGQDVVDAVKQGDTIDSIEILDSTDELFTAQKAQLEKWNAVLKK